MNIDDLYKIKHRLDDVSSRIQEVASRLKGVLNDGVVNDILYLSELVQEASEDLDRAVSRDVNEELDKAQSLTDSVFEAFLSKVKP
jgi:hypothetical protein